jgi:hypothetical protein
MKQERENGKSRTQDFQRKFFAQGTGQQLFTAKEFEEGMAQAKAEIMAVAIQTTKQAIGIEREACAQIAEQAGFLELAQAIRTRMQRAS